MFDPLSTVNDFIPKIRPLAVGALAVRRGKMALIARAKGGEATGGAILERPNAFRTFKPRLTLK